MERTAGKDEQRQGLAKTRTGIFGLDEVTAGGLPKGRSTLLVGGAGTGKTLIGLEFIRNGILHFKEPGVFMSFEEKPEELIANVSCMGWDLASLQKSGKLCLDHIQIDPGEYQVTGDYNLEGLFLILEQNVRSVGAGRLVLDGIDAVFSAFDDPFLFRMELKRLVRWLRERGITAIINCERGRNGLTRHGIEEYISDCVIELDLRLHEEMATRRLRVIKYRGSDHGHNEYPFLISDRGISVFPITSLTLEHDALQERVSSGIESLDAMLGGKGFFRSSTILVSGTAGTGKSSLAGHFANAACSRGERVLYMAFEESPQQIIRNMASLGLELGKWQERGQLKFYAVRSTLHGLEPHLMEIYDRVEEHDPQIIIMDPMSNLEMTGTYHQVKSFLTRLIDYCKSRKITALFTNLLEIGSPVQTEEGVSSLMDTWIMIVRERVENRFHRSIFVIKSRGMKHSEMVHSLQITDQGLVVDKMSESPGEG